MDIKKSITVSNAELGKSLVADAEDFVNKRKIEKVMRVVAEQTALLEEANCSITIATMQKEHYEKVLAAIEKGKFEILSNGVLSMHDKKLSLGRFQPPESRVYGG